MFKFRESLYFLYKELGNFEEIMNMSYWRFRDILHALTVMYRREAGLPVIRKLRKSNKDLINNLKRLKNDES